MRTAILMLLLTVPALASDEDYELGPDSVRQEPAWLRHATTA